MATRGADVSILRSTARSIGCEGKRVKDSAADYVPDIWNLYFLSVDDHGKKIYLYCLYFSLCKYERSRSSRNERVLNFKLEIFSKRFAFILLGSVKKSAPITSDTDPIYSSTAHFTFEFHGCSTIDQPPSNSSIESSQRPYVFRREHSDKPVRGLFRRS